ENNPSLKRLIQAIKDMQKESEKVKEAEKGIKKDHSDTDLSTNQVKELLNNAKIPTSGRDAVIFGKNNLTPEIVEFLHKNNKKMIIEKASNKELELLQDANFRHPEDVRASLEHETITHILKRHGVNSVNVRNGESPITYQDIANYRSFIDGADDVFVDNNNLIAFKQINGYVVVVEQAVNRKSELVLKTMYKSNGDYKDNNAYKKLQDTKPSKGQP
ncbi:PBECR3 domain-containing polyvalent protein, partial [Helicobacter pylori]|uniref:PBECR3 domain-containing polyvalent protein n=1 Tax=Helicobacter pylori TaxID=210 RepID=UPI001BB35AF2